MSMFLQHYTTYNKKSVKVINSSGSMFNLVHPAGFEPTTFYSGGRRSIQLSYGCPFIMFYNIAPDSVQGKCNNEKKRNFSENPQLSLFLPITAATDSEFSITASFNHISPMKRNRFLETELRKSWF